MDRRWQRNMIALDVETSKVLMPDRYQRGGLSRFGINKDEVEWLLSKVSLLP